MVSIYGVVPAYLASGNGLFRPGRRRRFPETVSWAALCSDLETLAYAQVTPHVGSSRVA